MNNFFLYGYGVKGFMLCMIEIILKVIDNKVKIELVNWIIEFGKELLWKFIELIDGVEEVLK